MTYDSWLAEPYEYPDRYLVYIDDMEVKCSICGDEEEDMIERHSKLYCSSCSRKCLWCEDYMLREDGVQLSDGCMHKACHEDWQWEMCNEQ